MMVNPLSHSISSKTTRVSNLRTRLQLARKLCRISPLRVLLFVVLGCTTFLSPSSAFALFLAGNQGSDVPFDVTYEQSLSLSFDQVLSVRNQFLLPVSIAAWQLELELHPTSGAHGSLNFTAISAAEDPLFDSGIGPAPDPELPSDHVQTSDADTGLLGRLLLSGEWGNIVKLSITASPNAAGTFELVSPVFNPLTPEFGSSWLPPLAFEPEGFENATLSSLSGFVLLGTIHINGASAPGDFNGDTVVDAQDYNKWRSEFGQTADPPGSGSDGNINGVVDGADYVVWRKNCSGPLESGVSIPEPQALTLLLVFIGVRLGFSSYRIRRPSLPI